MYIIYNAMYIAEICINGNEFDYKSPLGFPVNFHQNYMTHWLPIKESIDSFDSV